jgi:DNA-binding HxlR family transcriptional regulator
MSKYVQSCPVAMSVEILGERWTLLIIRELFRENHRFNDIARGLPRISAAILTSRLKSLQKDGVLERRMREDGGGYEYHLTEAGQALWPVIEALGAWGQRYVETRPVNVDPGLLMLWIYEDLKRDRLPNKRVVCRFAFAEPARSYWLVLDGEQTEVCFTHPGHDDDVIVKADPVALSSVYFGKKPLRAALAERSITIEGPPGLVRAFPSWLGLNVFAPFAQDRTLQTLGAH